MKVIITEHQEQVIINSMLNEELDYGNKRKLVKDFLDKNFQKGTIDVMDGDGNPSKQGVAVMLTQDRKPVKAMTDTQLFYYIQAQFKTILPETERDEFLKNAIIAWYNGKIDKNGDVRQ